MDKTRKVKKKCNKNKIERKTRQEEVEEGHVILYINMMVCGNTHTKILNLKLNKSPTHLFTSFTLNKEFEKLNSTF